VYWIYFWHNLSAGEACFNGEFNFQPQSIILTPVMVVRMFTSSLTEEAKALEEHIEAVKDKVEDPVMCEKIRRFVYAPKEIQDLFKSDAG
jgi:hypothetical protein